jgi:hypothetical protein
MNPRERILAVTVILLIITAGLGFGAYQFYLSPMKAKRANLLKFREEELTKLERVKKIMDQRPRLERYRQESLPGDVDVAKLKYTRFLKDLLETSNFRNISVTSRAKENRGTPTLTNKTPIYTPLSFSVSGNANIENLVTMLESFYRKGLLHQIRTLDIKRPLTLLQDQRQDELDVTMTVEALVVNGADKRDTLMPTLNKQLGQADVVAGLQTGPTGLGAALWAVGPFGPRGPGVLAQPDRDYSAMAAKNIFFGPPRSATAARPVTQLEELRFTILTDITKDLEKNRISASLYDQANQAAKDHTTLRTLGGFNEFSLLRTNQAITLVHGEVLQIDDLTSSLVFRVVLNSEDPEDKAPYYKDRERIYKLHSKDAEALARDGLINTADTSRLFWVDKGRWDFLVNDKMVTVDRKAFAFKYDLVKGFIVREDPDGVIIRLDDKYCGYRYPENAKSSRPPHEGYCLLRIGGNVADALTTPLKEEEFKKWASR